MDMKNDWELRAASDHVKAIVGSSKGEEEFWYSGEQEYREFIKPRLVQAKGDLHVIADWGCGAGRITRVLAREYRHVVGVDVSPTMIKKAATALSSVTNVRFIESNGSTAPEISDGEVDAVISWEVLIHLPAVNNVNNLLREFARVLRSGGVVVCTVNVSTGWMKLKGVPVFPRRLRSLLPRPLISMGLVLTKIRHDRRKNTWRGALITGAKWRKLFASAGLQLYEMTPIAKGRIIHIVMAIKK